MMNWKLKAFSILIICFAVTQFAVLGQVIQSSTNTAPVAITDNFSTGDYGFIKAENAILRLDFTEGLFVSGPGLITLRVSNTSAKWEVPPFAYINGDKNKALAFYPNDYQVDLVLPYGMYEAGTFILIRGFTLDAWDSKEHKNLLDPGDILKLHVSGAIGNMTFTDGTVDLVLVVKKPEAARR